MLPETKVNMIFLIGGPPRVGKTTISSEIRQRYAISVVAGCAILLGFGAGSVHMPDEWSRGGDQYL